MFNRSAFASTVKIYTDSILGALYIFEYEKLELPSSTHRLCILMDDLNLMLHKEIRNAIVELRKEEHEYCLRESKEANDK